MMEALTEGRKDGRTDRRTNGRTDTQNFERYNIIPSPLFAAGHKKRIPIRRTWLVFGLLALPKEIIEKKNEKKKNKTKKKLLLSH